MNLDNKSKGRIIAGIRRAFLYSPLRKSVKIEIKKGKFRCNKCKKLFGRKEVAVDHIKPVVDPKEGFPMTYILADDDRFESDVQVFDFTRYIYAMFCPKKFIQILCHVCHKVKTGRERKVAYARRKAEKFIGLPSRRTRASKHRRLKVKTRATRKPST